MRGGRASLGRSSAGGWRTPPAGGGTRRSFWSAAAVTCARCAPTARRGLTGRVSAARSDTLDSERIAREPLAHSLLPKAFKRAGEDQGPDELHQLLALWHDRRRSVLASRQHLVGEAEQLLGELALELREQLPDSKGVRPRLAALQRRNRRRRYAAPTRLRLQLLDGYHAQIKALDREEKQVTAALEELVDQSGSTLGELCGLSTRSVAELLVETGDVRRFTEAGFRRLNATAPLPASTAEGPGEPVRHRYNPGGNRRVNAVLHRMAVTSCAASRAPRRSTPAHAPAGTPRRRPAASSSDTSQTSSIDA